MKIEITIVNTPSLQIILAASSRRKKLENCKADVHAPPSTGPLYTEADRDKQEAIRATRTRFSVH